MPRKPDVDRPTSLLLKLPESERARLDLFLFSELEGRVPKGKYQEFFRERMVEFFDSQELSLEAYGFPAGYFVRGPKAMIEALKLILETRGM